MADMSDAELGEIYDFAVQLGKDAGDKLMLAATSRFSGETREDQAVEEKESAVDIVTKTDQGATELLPRQVEGFVHATKS